MEQNKVFNALVLRNFTKIKAEIENENKLYACRYKFGSSLRAEIGLLFERSNGALSDAERWKLKDLEKKVMSYQYCRLGLLNIVGNEQCQ